MQCKEPPKWHIVEIVFKIHRCDATWKARFHWGHTHTHTHTSHILTIKFGPV